MILTSIVNIYNSFYFLLNFILKNVLSWENYLKKERSMEETFYKLLIYINVDL